MDEKHGPPRKGSQFGLCSWLVWYSSGAKKGSRRECATDLPPPSGSPARARGTATTGSRESVCCSLAADTLTSSNGRSQ
ncbi:hypothetical protein MRX96_046444 [Rhipicephalus microplus]